MGRVGGAGVEKNAAIASAVLALCLTGASLADEPVKSFLEMRQERVVVQQWDVSCGAAALATVLTYQHGDPITEREIARGLINRAEYLAIEIDPLLAELGFSLLDLKRYVEHRGYQGSGYGRLSVADLEERAPVIVPVNFIGYPHFVVFRGLQEGRVLIADPAWGNRTMSRERFESAWLDYPGLGRVGFVVTKPGSPRPANRLAPRVQDFVRLR